MIVRYSFLLLLLFQFPVFALSGNEKIVWMDALSIQSFSEGIRPSMAGKNYVKETQQIAGVPYEHGVGVITVSILAFRLNGHGIGFHAEVGADDAGNPEIPVEFFVLGDGRVLFSSGSMKVGEKARTVDVDLRGIRQLGLLVTDPVGGVKNKRTYANWANARFTMTEGFEPEKCIQTGKGYILTPASGKAPQINSARVFGARPGNPFHYLVAATGLRPMEFRAENLPDGLTLDKNTGLITGKVERKGSYRMMLHARNRKGESALPLRIEIGDAIALTPPMGWNGWNSWADQLDRSKVMASARAMATNGMKDHGWSFINIDDTWQGVRGGSLRALQPNNKFPSIGEMVDSIHALGLKAGIYSTPYISSYASYVGGSSDYEKGGETHELLKVNKQPYMHVGKFRFETEDARQMALWGFDFLKYDWRIDLVSAERMSEALRNSGRDIVFSLSNNAPIELAGEWARVSNMFRTGPDIRDSWMSLYSCAFTLDKWAPFGGPGHWNDPDMLILGNVSTGINLHPTRLTPDEQYSHVSIFCLLAAPLLVGCPLEQLDPFTLNLLCNDEVLAVDQDPLGKSARLLSEKDGFQVWVKPLEDGSQAVGLFNTGFFGQTPKSWFRWGNEPARQITLDFASVGLKGSWHVRDLWRQKELSAAVTSFTGKVPHHGVILLKLSPARH